MIYSRPCAYYDLKAKQLEKRTKMEFLNQQREKREETQPDRCEGLAENAPIETERESKSKVNRKILATGPDPAFHACV